jgi:Zn-dependent protease with chaperone function
MARKTRPSPARAFDDIYASLAERWGKRVFDGLSTGKTDARRTITPSRFVSVMLSLGVYLVWLSCFIGAALMVWAWWPSVGAIILAIILLLVGWAVLPRWGKPPSGVVERDRIPTIYALVDGVCDELHARRVRGVVITSDLNASISRIGFRRQPYLFLGLPLWEALDPQERLAVLGHEAGHDINGDPFRGRLIGGALRSLGEWRYLLRPMRAHEARAYQRNNRLAELIANVIAYPFFVLARATARALIATSWMASQRAEYLADHIGADLAGSRAMASALSKVIALHPAFQNAVRKATIGKEAPFFDAWHGVIAETDGQLPTGTDTLDAKARFDVTHPPTPYRLALLQKDTSVARMTLSHDESDRIDAELEKFEPSVANALVLGYTASLGG